MQRKEAIMPEKEKNSIIRYGILALEHLERELTADEEKEMLEIQRDLNLSHDAILDKVKDAILS